MGRATKNNAVVPHKEAGEESGRHAIWPHVDQQLWQVLKAHTDKPPAFVHQACAHASRQHTRLGVSEESSDGRPALRAGTVHCGICGGQLHIGCERPALQHVEASGKRHPHDVGLPEGKRY